MLLPHKIVMAPECGHMLCYIIRGGANVQSHTRTHVRKSRPPSLLDCGSLPTMNRRCLLNVPWKGKCAAAAVTAHSATVYLESHDNHPLWLLTAEALARFGVLLHCWSTQLEKSSHDSPCLASASACNWLPLLLRQGQLHQLAPVAKSATATLLLTSGLA